MTKKRGRRKRVRMLEVVKNNIKTSMVRKSKRSSVDVVRDLKRVSDWNGGSV